MNDEEKRMLEEMVERMPENIRRAFEDAAGSSGMTRDAFMEGILDRFDAEGEELSPDEEEFLRAVFVGDCPDCGSAKTVSGDEIEQIDDPTVGYCEECGLLWCVECGMQIPAGSECGHWDVCEECGEEKDEFGDCGISPGECPFIMEWQAGVATDRITSACAWCGSAIPEGDEVFGAGARIREGIDFVRGSGREGFLMEVTIAGRRVPVIVTGRDSEARRQGNDLLFMTCTAACAEELKAALERERDIVEKIQLN